MNDDSQTIQQQWREGEDPSQESSWSKESGKSTPRLTLKEEGRFWSRVKKNCAPPLHVADLGPCWLWQGAKNRAGYGRLILSYSFFMAHRISYEILNGPIPNGLLVCHKCDVPNCVNPKHLFAGTNADNMRDMRRKGRGVTIEQRFGKLPPEKRQMGSQHVCSKLNEVKVKELRFLLLNKLETCASIAHRFNVTPRLIRYANKEGWKHVPLYIAPEPDTAQASQLVAEQLAELKRQMGGLSA